MTQQNEKKSNFSEDKAVQTAKEIIEKMPSWQQTYANEIIKSATVPVSMSSTLPPKMLG